MAAGSGAAVCSAPRPIQVAPRYPLPVDRFDLIVIGGGPAGTTAALRAAELGARVALVERDLPGGTCTDDGCAPTRVLAKAARLLRDLEQLPAYGLGTVGAATVDLPALLAATQRTVYELHEKKQLIGHLEGAGVTLASGLGPVGFVDGHRVQSGDGQAFEADRFIVAAGGHARRLPFPGGELALTHSDVWEMRQLPVSMAIVGAAATGAQLASVFAAFGTKVTLLELAPRVLPGEDRTSRRPSPRPSRPTASTSSPASAGSTRSRRDDQESHLVYRTGDGPVTLDVEAVMLAVGWPGNLDDLHLDAAGVATDRGYVTVDDQLRTTRPAHLGRRRHHRPA